MKACGRCKETLPLASFNFKDKIKKIYQSYCIECNKAKNREHYKSNKNTYKEKAKKYREENGRTVGKQELYIYEYKLNNPCVDCGDTNPVHLSFDHRDPKEKSFNIGLMRTHYSLEAVIAEIEKCDIRCHNCHAERTAKQYGWYQHPAYQQIRIEYESQAPLE